VLDEPAHVTPSQLILIGTRPIVWLLQLQKSSLGRAELSRGTP
jgi:hypothetical protein